MTNGDYLPISLAIVSCYIRLNFFGVLSKLDLRAYIDAISPYTRLILLFRAPKKCRLYFIWQDYDTKKLLYRLSYG